MKHLLKLLLFIVITASALSAGDNVKKPNVVLIVSDDHGTNDLGCYGNDKIKTPNLDKLAEEGVRFVNAYATSASCTASRSAILSGLYNHANGLYGHSHHYHNFKAFEHVQTLPVLLEKLADYRTARVGKYHLAPESVYKFQTVLKANSRNSVEMSDKCKSFVSTSSDKPFFLYYCTSDPHRGGGIVEESKYKPDRFGNIEKGYDGIVKTEFDPADVIVPPYLPDNPECRAELAQYYQSVARMDQGIGLLFKHLKNSGEWENTVIIYISDNGIAFPGAKTTVYQPGLNLPCIVKYNNSKGKNIVLNEMINWADLTPTILDIAGVLITAEESLSSEYNNQKGNWDNTVNQKFHGRSFKSVLEGNSEDDWNETFGSHTFHEITMYYPMRTVITDKYKLIWNIAHYLPYPHASDLWESATWQSVINSENKMYANKNVEKYTYRSEFELFDIVNDPDEKNNLADNSEFNDTLEKMKAKLKEFQKRTNDPWVIKWEHE
ncbi:MAG: sulfatase [Melioribacteraceae bacterium]|nr:sulfatase [Melioribacteraceae bacterium]